MTSTNGGIYFNGGTGLINHALIRYAGDNPNVSNPPSAAAIDIYNTPLNGEVIIDNTMIDNNAWNTINVEADELHQVRLSNNEIGEIRMIGGSLAGDVTLNPQKIGRYSFGNTLAIPQGVTLTIEASTTIAGADHGYLEVQGHLQVNGTAGSPVTFTSTENDGINQWEEYILMAGQARSTMP